MKLSCFWSHHFLNTYISFSTLVTFFGEQLKNPSGIEVFMQNKTSLFHFQQTEQLSHYFIVFRVFKR